MEFQLDTRFLRKLREWELNSWKLAEMKSKLEFHWSMRSKLEKRWKALFKEVSIMENLRIR